LRSTAVFVPSEKLNHSHVFRSKLILAEWCLKERMKLSIARGKLVELLSSDNAFWVPTGMKMCGTRDVLELDGKVLNAEVDAQLSKRTSKEMLSYAITNFLEYLKFSKGQFLVFKNNSVKNHSVTRSLNRFSNTYQKRVKVQLNALFKHNYKVGVFLTLTLDPKLFIDQYDM